MSNDINVGVISEALNDKMDRDTNNRASNIQVIIKTFEDGASGYRIWSDGYCEQWGYLSGSWSSGQDINVAFIKKFKNTNYHPDVATYRDTTSDYGTVYIKSKSINSMIVFSDGPSTIHGLYWKVAGYLAEGEY